MQHRVRSSQEAEQKVASIALQGLCMTDSQAGYHPECNLYFLLSSFFLFSPLQYLFFDEYT